MKAGRAKYSCFRETEEVVTGIAILFAAHNAVAYVEELPVSRSRQDGVLVTVFASVDASINGTEGRPFAPCSCDPRRP